MGHFFFSGNRSQHEDEACRHHFFTGKEPLQYFLADERSIECPFQGKFVASQSSVSNTPAGKYKSDTVIPNNLRQSSKLLRIKKNK